MEKKKRAALHNLGCKVNAYETDAMQQMLEEAGYEIVPFSQEAEVYLINTCSVTNMADRKSRQMIHRARKLNPKAVVVATGCYVQTSTQQVIDDLAVDIVIGNNQKNQLVDLLEEYLGKEEQEKVISCVDVNAGVIDYENLQVEKTGEHTRVFIKVQDGCNQFCSYCIIPFARGRVRSRSVEDVVKEVKHLAAAGYQEVVLTGIHLSSYGLQEDYNVVYRQAVVQEQLLKLIEAVAQVEGIRRIRLGSLEPQVITEDFAKRLSAVDKICPHFHLSLQSGCDATLRRMNRKYTCEEYELGCDILRRHFDHPAITTDVIVGFPGETEEEFRTTKEFVRRIGFYEMHIFKYSKRQGTKAATMPNQVPEEIKARRSDELLELEKEMSKAYRESYVKREVEVLLETPTSIEGVSYYTGYTREYIRVAVKTNQDLSNTIVDGIIQSEIVDKTYKLSVER
ncbi:MAG: tRNA (N(6)-L-threonylcarbamoyladenosine(37)-C(2))-methylthiotransferase MtaB [Lachnospiraceae bacterium]|nr:tRNA (N(6)-L-threonylcarbamoyladenosine(37)-C(2))-methylthiotransferase MtaB [Lachnospiraceae bacterium]